MGKSSALSSGLSPGEKLIASVCRMARIGTWEYDLKNGNGIWSDDLYDIMGLAHSAAPPPMQDYGTYVNKSYVPLLKEKWSNLTNLNEPFDIEVEMFTVQKKLIWVRAMGEPIIEKGNCVKARGIFQDITKSKELEIKLRKKNEQLNHIIRKVPGAVFRCKNNEAFDIDFISNQILDISGYQAEEFSPQGKIEFSSIIKETDRKKVFKALQLSMDSNTSEYEIQYRIITKNGTEKWISEKGTLIEDNQYIEGIITDIDDRVKIEERILKATLQAEDIERKRISKELNDNVQQILASSLYFFQALEDDIQKLNEDQIKLYESGISHLIKGLEESRLIAYSVMPMSISDFGLISTLESMVLSLQKESNIAIELVHNLDKRLNEIVEVCLFRICQEAISNVIRHSNASHVTIKLWQYKDVVHFSIEDNGAGFNMIDNPQFESSGRGISYMKSRAQSINATFEISSMENVGTYVMIEIPWDHHLIK